MHIFRRARFKHNSHLASLCLQDKSKNLGVVNNALLTEALQAA